MSYSLIDNCNGCTKFNINCKDREKIENAITNIHNEHFETGNHKGCGFVDMICFNNDSKDPNFSFGQSIEQLKQGSKMARKGWNGKNMFVYYVPGGEYKSQTYVAKKEFGETAKYNPYFAIKNMNNSVSIWVPSVNDIFAKDWFIVE